MMTDPLSDMLNQIMNSQAVKKPVVWLPASKVKLALAKLLKKHHYLNELKRRGLGSKNRLGLVLQYFEGEPAISGFQRISKPGRRFYISTKEIRRGKGLLILSTSHGLMSGEEARKKEIGGEVIMRVW
jgi:small subunit ribosomal protein S8